jgi:hypothetical protein
MIKISNEIFPDKERNKFNIYYYPVYRTLVIIIIFVSAYIRLQKKPLACQSTKT